MILLEEIKKQIESLQNLISGGILYASEGEPKIYMLIEKAVIKKHSRAINQRSNGRYITKAELHGNVSQISANTYQELIEKLYDFYFSKANSTLESLYPLWIEYRRNETATTEKTIKENDGMWRQHLLGQSITKRPLRILKPKDYMLFFREITKDRTMTRKHFNDLKSVMNGILYYAIEQEIIEHNPLNDINYSNLPYKANNTEIIPFSEEERLQVIYFLGETDIYDLAIKLMFYLTIRIGELKGLRFDDINGNSIRICRFINDKHEIVEHIKGNADAGIRSLPLPPEAKRIINIIKEMYPDNEYMFMIDSENQKFITTVTFNRHLKKCCEALNIFYRSSHKIRFTNASLLNDKGVSVPDVQKLMGHASEKTTHGYLKSIKSQRETHEKVVSIFAS